MAKRILSSFINDLISQTNIIDLIKNKIPINKKGKNFLACCPFHDDKNPSFTVNEDKQFYYCFGCGVHGNVIDFLMLYEHINFVEAIQELASIQGKSVIYEKNNDFYNKQLEERQKLYELMEKVKNFYQLFLIKNKSHHAYRYLETRGINKKSIQTFSIGYAPENWNHIRHFLKLNIEECNLLVKTGVLIKNKKNQYYERFRNRIMFPLRDQYGKIIGFGGRVINKNFPKYLNSPETCIFHKKEQLYGFFEQKTNYIKKNCLIIVEGYFDVISLNQFGINYSVASLGTSITVNHIQNIFKVVDKVICCYDGDFAGKKAAWRLLTLALSYIRNTKQMYFVFLPLGQDPDSLIHQEGNKIFKKRIKQAIPLTKFFFDSLLSKIDLSTDEGKMRLSTLAQPLIDQVQSKTLYNLLYQTLKNKLGIFDENKLNTLNIKKNYEKKIKENSDIKSNTIRLLVALLIQNPYLSKIVPSLNIIDTSKIVGLSLFMQIVKHCKDNDNLKTANLLELYRQTNLKKTIEKLSIYDHMIDKKKIKTVFQDSLVNILHLLINRHLEILIANDRKYGLNASDKQKFWVLKQMLLNNKIKNWITKDSKNLLKNNSYIDLL
ncbi:DNA primase [Candidatus Tachikawaea gelatinosa]|uniref:DNA primase n=1 Tax=Candidatus Tachikawaea gelatinosa TaxID=1410383 RepID=A0A090AQK6_9ENTR|nr:DNA primase [Candidatus Tachikawaea gelatinosa]BAP58627.1 DNA primase [Candidatus Tachikawaea gelatinosa]